MQHYPRDLFDEMDELAARLFSRMDREFMAEMPGRFRQTLWADERETVRGDRDTEPAPVPEQAPEGPVAEVHHIGDEVKVIVDLPGIGEDALRLVVRGGNLIIDAGDAENHIRTSVALPPVDAATMGYTLKNGILEVSIRALSA